MVVVNYILCRVTVATSGSTGSVFLWTLIVTVVVGKEEVLSRNVSRLIC